MIETLLFWLGRAALGVLDFLALTRSGWQRAHTWAALAIVVGCVVAMSLFA